MHHTLGVIAEILALGAIVTLIGAWLIERVHPPRGRFVEVGGLRQHVVEIGDAAAIAAGRSHSRCRLQSRRHATGARRAARCAAPRHPDRSGRLGLERTRGEWWRFAGLSGGDACGVLDRLGVERALIVGHSWGGALAVAFALDHPARTAGLVLLAAPFYPFNRSMTWLYTLFAAPVFGLLYAHTLALPLGTPFIGIALGSAFLPQWPPHRYVSRTAALLLLRPAAFLANARDVADLAGNLERQTARYAALIVPTTIMTGDRDMIVAPRKHALALAAAVPRAKLVVLSGIGHMLHHAAAERVVAEVEAMSGQSYSSPEPSPT